MVLVKLNAGQTQDFNSSNCLSNRKIV